MSAITADQALSSEDLKKERVEVPEWGGYMFIQTMMGTDRDLYEESCVVERDGKFKQTFHNMRSKLVARCAVDDNGKRIFSEKQVAELGKKSAKVLDRLFAKAQELNGISDDDIEALGKP